MQKTISKEIEISGIGIHSGQGVKMKLLPALENTGVVFRVGKNEIRAAFDNVRSTNMSTNLANNNVKAAVVEHLMAALWGVGIDNTIILLDGEELPILDGSAYPFVEALESVGLIEQSTPRKLLYVRNEIVITEGDKYVKLIPQKRENTEINIDMTIDFDHPAIGKQKMVYNGQKDSFIEIISKARTFGFMSDLEMLHKHGLGLGASLDNCIGIDEEKVVNKEGLRFKNEFVRHKILDCIGDLFLSGYRLCCDVIGYKTGHKLNNAVLHKLFSDPDNYTIL